MPILTDQQLAAMERYLAYHRNHPQVPFEAHCRRQVRELGLMVLSRRRVYLDICYWIYLRDANLGRPQKSWHSELLSILRERVDSAELICPISDSAFFELQRQSDPQTRLATARLIDALSLGVTTQNAMDRLQTELIHFLRSVTVEHVVPGPPIHMIWLKVGHVLGTPQLSFPGMDPNEQSAITKALFDLMWDWTLEEMLTDMPTLEDPTDSAWKEDAARITRKSAEHAREITDFETLYLAEIRGFFDAHVKDLQQAYMWIQRYLYVDAPEPSRREVEGLAQTLVDVVRSDKVGAALPMAQVVSGLHAAVRWKRNRPFRSSDFYDFYHAAAALPYCDAFFTEKDMGTALSTPPLLFHERFETRIAWNEVGVLGWLGSVTP